MARWPLTQRRCKRCSTISGTSSAYGVVKRKEGSVPCPRQTLHLAKKLGLKTRHVKSTIVKERIELVWGNKIIAGLDGLPRVITITYAKRKRK